MQAPTHPETSANDSISPGSQWGGRATRAEIDLDALASNCAALRGLAGNAELVAVVKADAYGHGAIMVARTVLNHGAGSLAVYTVEEGVQLRRAGIEARVLLLGPFGAAEAEDLVDARLTPTVGSAEAAQHLESVARGRTIPIHVELDTGLSRAGVEPGRALTFVRSLSRFAALELEGVFTHLARADELGAPSVSEQLEIFHSTVGKLGAAGYCFRVRHVANSAAVLYIPETRLDIVRTGIGLFGYSPSLSLPCPVDLRPVLSLLSAVTRIQDAPVGTGVGYGHDFRCDRPSRLALVPIGYGDGMPRCLGNGRGQVLIRGRTARIVGRVSMDQITLDVTDIPGAQTGDSVAIIGSQGETRQTADDLARAAGTISYEILTGLQLRVPRLYFSGGKRIAVRRMADLV